MSTRSPRNANRAPWLAAGAVAVLGVALWLGLRVSTEPTTTAGATAERPTPTPERAEGGPVRPRTPPVQGRDAPPVPDEPVLPPNADELRLAAYQKAVEEERPRPGEQAFRAMVSAFVEHNHRMAEEQAKAEGLELEEVEELTFLGLMAQESQRWSEVERVLGGPVYPQKRAEAEAMLTELDGEFEQSMRALVADGGSAEDRWTLIHEFERDYRERYFDITGMDEDQLDDLLAGDASRKYAPGSTPPPEDMPPREDDPAPVETRQGGEPPPP